MEMPTQTSLNVIKIFKTARHFQQKPKPEFLKSTISNKSENAQHSILSTFTWHHFCPPSSETPIFRVPKRGGQLKRNQVDNELMVERG